MTFLATGTAQIPTIDARGAALSPEIADRLRTAAKQFEGCRLIARIHPSRWLALENSGITVKAVVINEVGSEVPAMRLPSHGMRLFAGFPVELNVLQPDDRVSLVSPTGIPAVEIANLAPLLTCAT